MTWVAELVTGDLDVQVNTLKVQMSGYELLLIRDEGFNKGDREGRYWG